MIIETMSYYESDYDPHEDWRYDDFREDEYDDTWATYLDDEIDIERMFDAMGSGGYGRSFDPENPSASSVRWNGDALERLLKGIGYGIFPNFLDELRDHANQEAITEGARYASAVHTEEERHGTDFPPGGYIYTKNYEARLDEVYHATLLKVLDKAESILAKQAAAAANGIPTGRPLPAGVKQSIGKDGRVRYHGINPKTGRQGFVSNPYR